MMKEIAKIMPEDEFQKFLDEKIRPEVTYCKSQNMGYISIKCQLATMLENLEDQDKVFTVGQLKQIFELAK